MSPGRDLEMLEGNKANLDQKSNKVIFDKTRSFSIKNANGIFEKRSGSTPFSKSSLGGKFDGKKPGQCWQSLLSFEPDTKDICLETDVAQFDVHRDIDKWEFEQITNPIVQERYLTNSQTNTTSSPQKNPNDFQKMTLTKLQDSTLNKIPTRAINYINSLDAPAKFDSESKTGAAHGPARYEWGLKENI